MLPLPIPKFHDPVEPLYHIRPAANVTAEPLPKSMYGLALSIRGPDKVGALENTKLPEPVSSVIAAAKLADDGVAAHVPTAGTAKLTVPVVVIGPPVRPVPVATEVTEPAPVPAPMAARNDAAFSALMVLSALN